MSNAVNEFEVDISGLDAGEVLAALYNRSRPVGMGMLNPKCYNTMSIEEGTDHVNNAIENHNGNIDYCQGRPIKIKFGDSKIDVRLYERDLGNNSARSLISIIRNKK